MGQHKCSPLAQMYIGNNKAFATGNSTERIFAIPMNSGITTDLWVGTTSCIDATKGAKTAVSLVEYAKKHNFERVYCPSLAQMMYPNISK